MKSQMCEENTHELCNGHFKLGRLNKVCECPCHFLFDSPSKFLEAVSKLSHTQKDRMLMDLAWKCWVTPKGLNPQQISIQSYRTAKLIK